MVLMLFCQPAFLTRDDGRGDLGAHRTVAKMKGQTG
jgi:hypothetical protein